MGYFPRLLECRRQRFLVCGVIFGLFCVAWIYINVQGQTKIENVSGDVKPSFLGHHGVSENERRIWRKKFFAGVKKILGQFKENRSYPREGHENDTKLSELKRIRSHPRKSFEVAAHNGLFHFFEPQGHVTLFPQRWCCITGYLRQAVRRWEHYFSLWQQWWIITMPRVSCPFDYVR